MREVCEVQGPPCPKALLTNVCTQLTPQPPVYAQVKHSKREKAIARELAQRQAAI